MPNHESQELFRPRILAVDDERQIHASLRLRIGETCQLVCCSDAREALEAIAAQRFDLCFVDLHMPEMGGFTFIENAQRTDPALGYVVLSAFDSSENLRRTIPLHVFDFIGKPLPERHDFEARIPAWIDRTRAQRRDQAFVQKGNLISQDLDSARLEREVELVASASSRDALLQTANLLTTIHAHLVGAASIAAPLARKDSALLPLSRNLEEARKIADATTTAVESFFDSAYASRDTSPALVDSGLRHAIGIASRMSSAESANKMVDLVATVADGRIAVRGLSGIEFLLMLVPLIGAALVRTAPNTTVGISAQPIARLETAAKDPALRGFLWANRKSASIGQPGVLIHLTAAALAPTASDTEAWLYRSEGPFAAISSRGLVAGLQKSRGFLAVSVAPGTAKFQLAIALPV